MTKEYVWWLSFGVTLVTISAASEPCEVTLHETSSYSGTEFVLGEGAHYYDTDFTNDWAESMTVNAQSGYECTVYICENGDWTGVCETYVIDATTGDVTEQYNDFGAISGISTLKVTSVGSETAYYDLEDTIDNHEDTLIFGFTTGDAVVSAPKATVVIDAYLSDRSDSFWRCRYVGVYANTVYKCEEATDYVVDLDVDSFNPSGLENKLIFRAYEFDSMEIKNVFIGTKNKIMETDGTFAKRSMGYYTWLSYTPYISFNLIEHNDYAECDGKCTDIDEAEIGEGIPDTTYGIDYTIGEVKVDLRPAETFDYIDIESPILEYVDEASECQWKTDDLESSVADLYEEGPAYDMFDIANTIGAVTAAFPGFGEIGAGLMAANTVVDFITGATTPSTEELTQTALEEMVTSMDNMMVCTQEYTDAKTETLRNELNTRIDELEIVIQYNFDLLQNELASVQTNLDEKLEAKIVQLNYKIHLENVEQEIAMVQDVLKTIQRQLVYVGTMTDDVSKLNEIRNILVNTLPRFAYAFKAMPSDTEVDFFWKLYAKEMSIYIMEVMDICFNVWALWLNVNGVESPADIDTDYQLAFRDLTGELIAEYIDLLPMAIYALVVDDDAEEQLQRMRLTDRFAEIDLRLKPNLICAWILLAQYATDTTDMYFMGEYSELYGDDIYECQSNTRKTVLNKVLTVDAMTGGSGIYTDTSDTTHSFIVLSFDYTHWDGLHTGVGSYAVYAEDTIEWVADDLVELESNGDAVKGLRISVTTAAYFQSEYHSYQISKFGIIDMDDQVVEYDMLSSSDGDSVETFEVSCSDGYALGAVRFQTRNALGAASSVEDDYYDITGVKLLCRPLPEWAWGFEYGIFTDYEIVGASWLDPDTYAEDWVISYLEWNGCPIGRIVNQIDVQYHNNEEEGMDRVITFEMTMHCTYDGYFDYTPDDLDDNWWDEWTMPIILLMMVLIALQIVLCFLCKRKNSKNQKNKVEHFDEPTDLDEMVELK